MATQKSINPAAAIKQAEAIFAKIASLMSAVEHLAIDQIDAAVNEEAASKCVAIRELASQAGWLAEVGGGKLGGGGYRGGAEEWMLPPVYHELEASHA